MDEEMRAAIRRWIVNDTGEQEIERMMKDEDSYIDNWGRTLHAGVKTKEEVIDFLVDMAEGIQRFFKTWHAQHGTYPEPIKHSKPGPAMYTERGKP